MRQLLIAGMALLIASCAGPEGPEADKARALEKERPFSENLKQDGDELSKQAKEDFEAFKDQAVEDGKVVADNTHETVGGMANDLRDNVKKTGRYLRKWLLTPLPEEGKKLAVAPSYCYHVLQDILCYRQPMPGWEHRLAGYQGTHAAPPPPPVMVALPTRAVDEKLLPENRIANAKAVFKEIPEDSKAQEKDKSPTDAAAPPAEAAHETLPDPALAPQL